MWSRRSHHTRANWGCCKCSSPCPKVLHKLYWSWCVQWPWDVMQVECVIKKHKEQLLKERYRFNMGLLMGMISPFFECCFSHWSVTDEQNRSLSVFRRWSTFSAEVGWWKSDQKWGGHAGVFGGKRALFWLKWILGLLSLYHVTISYFGLKGSSSLGTQNRGWPGEEA